MIDKLSGGNKGILVGSNKTGDKIEKWKEIVDYYKQNPKDLVDQIPDIILDKGTHARHNKAKQTEEQQNYY